jgi:PAS domain S-box-containing protein
MFDFFEFSNEMLCVADNRGYFTRVNPAWTKTLGWSADELTSRPYLDFVHPDDMPATIREAQLLLSGTHETIFFENRYRTPDGSYRWLSWQAKLAPGLGQLVAAARDVTDQKLQTAALQEAEERFRTLATHAPVGIAQADAAGSVFYANQKWCDLAGIRLEESLGFTWQRVIHPDDLGPELQKWQAALQAGQGLPPHELRFLHASGEVRWALSSVALIKDKKGEIVGQIATVEDITERKNAELALREAEERFRAFMDNSPAIAWSKDESGRIVFMNKTSEKQFNLRFDDWYGKTDFDFWPPETAQRLQANDRKVIESGQPSQIFEETVSPDRPLCYWVTILFPYHDRREKTYVGGIAIDITDLKRAEEALKAKQELLQNLIEVQEKEKQFLCNEFHDGLIQYSVGALMSLESFRRNLSSADDAAKIDTAISSLRKGVEDGRRAIHGIRPPVLDDLGLEAAIEDLVDQFSKMGIRVTSQCDSGTGRLPESIQTTVYRVVQESLNNAGKHSGSEVVRIELKRVQGDLHLEIRDFGCGFDVEPARKRGFGLRGMTERVRLSGGECTIESEPGAGTRVVVRIPIPGAGAGGA